MRRILGRYGINGVLQTRLISSLSGGQKARLNLAWLAEKRPAILALDEPTNSLDIETIDALADAINAFKGGLLLISHDFRLISQVTKEIWEVDNGAVTKWKVKGKKEKIPFLFFFLKFSSKTGRHYQLQSQDEEGDGQIPWIKRGNTRVKDNVLFY